MIMLITKCICKHILIDFMLTNESSEGFVSRHTLEERRDVYYLVETIENREVIHLKLL